MTPGGLLAEATVRAGVFQLEMASRLTGEEQKQLPAAKGQGYACWSSQSQRLAGCDVRRLSSETCEVLSGKWQLAVLRGSVFALVPWFSVGGTRGAAMRALDSNRRVVAA